MGIYMIGTISVDGENVIGYRLLYIKNGLVRDTTVESMKLALSSDVRVGNLELVNGEIKGSNGDISRYPMIIGGVAYRRSPIIILKEMLNGDYIVTDFKGEIVRMNEEEVVRYSAVEGIANGKVVNKDGRRFVSAIKGEYEKEVVVDYEDKVKKIEAKWDVLGTSDYKFNDKGELVVLNRKLTKVRIPSGVTRISDLAFRNLPGLTHVVLPANMEYIGYGAFMGCENLEHVEIPNGVVEIPRSCFAGCNSLVEVTLPETVRSIRSGAFLRCKKLERIYIKNPNVKISYGAIEGKCRKIIG